MSLSVGLSMGPMLDLLLELVLVAGVPRKRKQMLMTQHTLTSLATTFL